jgi:hypothetical protein
VFLGEFSQPGDGKKGWRWKKRADESNKWILEVLKKKIAIS